MKFKVVFIGGLTNGKIVHEYLQKNKYVDLVLTITYPDGTDKPRHIIFPDSSSTIKDANAKAHFTEIKKTNPDLIIVAGWSELLSKELIELPQNGTIGFHPSRLPNDRGRSVIAWQIEEGYQETALTMFYYNTIPDGGDIIAQEKVTIEDNDYLEDVLNKMDKATFNLMYAYFPLIRKGVAPRKKQDINEGNFRRLRTEKDSLIDWNNNAQSIYNKIRAISKPYPGAIGVIEKKRYKIWKAEKISNFHFGQDQLPGTLVASLFDRSLIVKCKDSFLHISELSEIK